MLSKSCVYAIRSIIFVAQKSSLEYKIGIKEIANELEIPTHYLGKILQSLTKNKFILSIKGPNGGFYIDKETKNIKLIEIIEVFDGLEFFTSCGLGLKECSDNHPCPIHDDLKKTRDSLWEIFNTNTIDNLVTQIKDGKSFIKNIIN